MLVRNMEEIQINNFDLYKIETSLKLVVSSESRLLQSKQSYLDALFKIGQVKNDMDVSIRDLVGIGDKIGIKRKKSFYHRCSKVYLYVSELELDIYSLSDKRIEEINREVRKERPISLSIAKKNPQKHGDIVTVEILKLLDLHKKAENRHELIVLKNAITDFIEYIDSNN